MSAHPATGRLVVAIGDLHCGHMAGLTPPAWHADPERDARAAALQRECWRLYCEHALTIGPPDLLIVNGDCIDGRGEASRGVELLTADRDEQAQMAIQCIRQWRARAVLMTYGTGYHTGKGEDWEGVIAREIGAEIHSQAWATVDGVTFHARHKVGASSVPHGRATALARSRLWQQLWSEPGRVPQAQVLLRSHVHYHQYVGGPGWLAMTLPPLQAAATRYGARECEGLVDWGVTWFRVSAGRVLAWEAEIAQLEAERCSAREY
jgi:hypothetical protein